MIGIILNDNSYEQDIRELLMAFFPGETFVHEVRDEVDLGLHGTLSEDRRSFTIQVVSRGPRKAHLWDMTPGEHWEADHFDEPIRVDYEDRFETKNKIKRRLYVVLKSLTGRNLPWGTLTGIRPTKIALTRLEEGMTEDAIFRHMKETYFTSDEKIALSIEIAKRERQLLSAVDYRDGYSLYVGIPFCPTTCLYCSFTSYPIGKWQGRTGLYLDALFQEMDYVA
ncbi:MAG: coproporphyrinogen dehydrogenase HemZ, partial [Clostridium sp.]|nr:coproporphyrinogen dehydrogenase HemZ [Clostridium sp.]